MFVMIDLMVDWAWASSPLIDPVVSRQKQTSMNPKAGRGRWSFDLVLKIVFLGMTDVGSATIFPTDLAPPFPRDFLDELFLAGATGRDGAFPPVDFLAGYLTDLEALALTIFFSFFSGLGCTDSLLESSLFFSLRVFWAKILFPSLRVSAMVLVLVAFFFLVASRNYWPS